jgi:hypothetical protein
MQCRLIICGLNAVGRLLPPITRIDHGRRLGGLLDSRLGRQFGRLAGHGVAERAKF